MPDAVGVHAKTCSGALVVDAHVEATLLPPPVALEIVPPCGGTMRGALQVYGGAKLAVKTVSCSGVAIWCVGGPPSDHPAKRYGSPSSVWKAVVPIVRCTP